MNQVINLLFSYPSVNNRERAYKTISIMDRMPAGDAQQMRIRAFEARMAILDAAPAREVIDLTIVPDTPERVEGPPPNKRKKTVPKRIT